MGLSNAEFSKYLKSGVEIKELLPILEKGISDAFGDPSKIINFDSAIQRLKNNLSQLLTVGEDSSGPSNITKFIDVLAEKIAKVNTVADKTSTSLSHALDMMSLQIDYWTGSIDSISDLYAKANELQDKYIAKTQTQINLASKVRDQEVENQQVYEVSKETLLTLDKNLKAAQERMGGLGNKSQIVGDVIAEAFKKIDLSNPQKAVTDIEAILQRIANKSPELGASIQEALLPAFKNLSKTDLDKMLAEVSRKIEDLPNKGKVSAALLSTQNALIAESLNRINAEYDKLGVTSSQSLSKSSDEMVKAYVKIRDAGKETSDVLDDAFLKLAESEIQAANAAARPVSEFIRQEAAARGLTATIDQMIVASDELSPAFETMTDKANQSRTVWEKSIRTFEDETNAKRESIQTSIKLARAKGDEYTATSKTVELSQYEVDRNRERIKLYQSLGDILDTTVNAMYAMANADGDYSEEERKAIQPLQDTVVALKQKTRAMEEQNPVLEQSLKKNQEAFLSNTTVAGGIKTQTTAQVGLNKELKEGEKTTDGFVKQGKNLVKHTNDTGVALQGLSSYLGKTRQAMSALSEATRLYFEKEFTGALMRHGVAGAFEAHRKAIHDFDASLSGSSRVLAGYQRELSTANELIKQSEEKMLFAANGFRVFEAAIEIGAGKAKKAFYEQAIGAEGLASTIQRLADGPVNDVNAALAQTANAAKSAESGFNLLDDNDLSSLRSAISAATSRLQQLRAEAIEARNDLNALNEEILREKGNTNEAEKLRLRNEEQQKSAELEEKIRNAQATGSSELIQTLSTQKSKLAELYDLKERNLQKTIKEREEAERREAIASRQKVEEDKKSKSKSAPSGTSGSSGSGIGGNKTFTFTAGGQKAQLPVGDVDEDTVNKMVDVFNKAGLSLAG